MTAVREAIVLRPQSLVFAFIVSLVLLATSTVKASAQADPCVVVPSPVSDATPAEFFAMNLEGTVVGYRLPDTTVRWEQRGSPICAPAAGFSDAHIPSTQKAGETFDVNGQALATIPATGVPFAQDANGQVSGFLMPDGHIQWEQRGVVLGVSRLRPLENGVSGVDNLPSTSQLSGTRLGFEPQLLALGVTVLAAGVLMTVNLVKTGPVATHKTDISF